MYVFTGEHQQHMGPTWGRVSGILPLLQGPHLVVWSWRSLPVPSCKPGHRLVVTLLVLLHHYRASPSSEGRWNPSVARKMHYVPCSGFLLLILLIHDFLLRPNLVNFTLTTVKLIKYESSMFIYLEAPHHQSYNWLLSFRYKFYL